MMVLLFLCPWLAGLSSQVDITHAPVHNRSIQIIIRKTYVCPTMHRFDVEQPIAKIAEIGTVNIVVFFCDSLTIQILAMRLLSKATPELRSW